MKKSKKLEIISSAKGTYDLCRCYFDYHKNYWYFYILDYSEKFLFGIEEGDFLLNGFQIRKISDLKKIEIKDDLCTKINKDKRILDNVNAPAVQLSSWYDIFCSLSEITKYLIVENEHEKKNGPYFYLGKVKKIKKSSIIFSPFDADGKWFDDVELPFSEITSVTFGDRYSKTYGEYVEDKQ
ncbi:MAG: hypothetical protein ACI4RG_00170 [Huintestinicola sp.]